MAKDKFEEVRLLCLGMVILQGNKKGVEYVVLDDEGKETADHICFTLKQSTRGCAGSVYTVQKSGGTIKGNLDFVEMFPDADRRAVIQLKAKATETHHQAYVQEKKAGLDDSAILEILRPLRVAYHSTNALGKSAMVARVIHFMQKGF